MKDCYWEEFSLEELREEFACLEEIECENQKVLAENGHHCADKSTDALFGLVNERDELRADLKLAVAALEMADTYAHFEHNTPVCNYDSVPAGYKCNCGAVERRVMIEKTLKEIKSRGDWPLDASSTEGKREEG